MFEFASGAHYLAPPTFTRAGVDGHSSSLGRAARGPQGSRPEAQRMAAGQRRVAVRRRLGVDVREPRRGLLAHLAVGVACGVSAGTACPPSTSPAALFGVGAVLHFFVRHRLPTIVPRTWTRERRSILWTDVGLAGFVVLMGTLVGFREFLLVQLPVALLSCSIGVWLFYVQHQFEPTYWEHDDRWAYHAAALEGSSY